MSKAEERNKELSNGCSMYNPCPICFKCMSKASHLYVRCQECPVEFCGHSEKQRAMMIRRENFALTVSKETEQRIIDWTNERKQQENESN